MDKNQFICPKCGETTKVHVIPMLEGKKKYQGLLGFCIFITVALLLTALILFFKLSTEGIDFFGSFEDSILKLGDNYFKYRIMEICSSIGGGFTLISFLLLLLRPTEYKIRLKGYCTECQFIWKINTSIDSEEVQREKAVAKILNKKYVSQQESDIDKEERLKQINKIMNEK